jgi:hypothetical protein
VVAVIDANAVRARIGICPSPEAGLAECVTDDELYWKFYLEAVSAVVGRQTFPPPTNAPGGSISSC